MPVDKWDESNGLGANWKSAQCVTSLYDSYIQVQQEKEQLQEELRRWHQKESLVTLQQPEELRVKELEQDIRLLRSEKLRMEEMHDLARQKLEARVVDSEAQYQHLVAKYQERFEFDPLEAKRAALAVKTIQTTLQTVLLEKEELGIRYGNLTDQHRRMYHEQVLRSDQLRQEVGTLKQHQVTCGQQRVLHVFIVWSTRKMMTAWRTWRIHTLDKRQQEERLCMMATFECQVDDRIGKIRDHQATLHAKKRMQVVARRTLDQWRDWTWQKVAHERKEASVNQETLSRLKLHGVLARWRLKTRMKRNYLAGVRKLAHLVALRSRTWGLRQWSVQSFRLAAMENTQQMCALNATAEVQNDTIKELEARLDEARNASHEVQVLHEQVERNYRENMDKQQVASFAVLKKLGRILLNHFARQLLKNVVRAWGTLVTYSYAKRQRTHLIQVTLQKLTLQKSMSRWHHSVCEKYRERLQTQCMIHRLRHFRTIRCFQKWKTLVNEQKLKQTARLDAITRMRRRKVAQCFLQWVTCRKQQMTVRNGLEKVIKLVARRHLVVAFCAWRQCIGAQRIHDQVQEQQQIHKAWEDRLERAKHTILYLQQAFMLWRQRALSRQERESVVRQCLARVETAVLAKTFGRWNDCHLRQKTQQRRVHRWARRVYSSSLRRGWNHWQQHIVLKAHQLSMHKLHNEKDAQLYQLETVFERYRATQQLMLDTARQVHLVQEKTLHDTINCLLTKKRLAQRLARVVQALSDAKHRTYKQVRALQAWHTAVRRSRYHRKTIETLQSLLRARHTRSFLLKWSHFTTQRLRLRAVFTVIQTCYSQRWQTQGFQAWNRARQQSKSVHRFATLYRLKSYTFVVRHTFQTWKTVTNENRVLRSIVKSIHGAILRQQFTHWMQWTSIAAANERRATRKVALTALQTRHVWHYAIATMRLCVAEWKRITTLKKTQHFRAQKLLLFQKLRLVSVCFHHWTNLVAINRIERDQTMQLERWLRAHGRQVQQRAMSLWKVRLIRAQWHKIRQLHEWQAAQQTHAASQRAKVVLFTITKHKLATVPGIHDMPITTMQYLSQCRLVAKSFHALKVTAFMTKYQHDTLSFWLHKLRRQHLARVFAHWHSFQQQCRQVKLVESRRQKYARESVAREILRHWQAFSYQQHVIKRKQYKVQQHARARLLKNAVDRWSQSAHDQRSIVRGAHQLARLFQRRTRTLTFLSWRTKCRDYTMRVHQARSRHKRLLEFVSHHHAAQLVHAFQSWQDWVQTNHAARVLAHQQKVLQCRVLILNGWHGWCAVAQSSIRKRKVLEGLAAACMRFYYRVAVARWQQCLVRGQLGALQSRSERLSNQVVETNRQLHTKSLHAAHLLTKVRELQQHLVEATSHSSSQRAKGKAKARLRRRQLGRLQALSKVMLKRTVCRELFQAFVQWKDICLAVRSTHCRLVRVAERRQRRQRMLAFCVWKHKTLQWQRLESVQQRWRASALQRLVQHWQKVTLLRAKQRYFVMKRCLLSSTTRTLPVSVAFRLWNVKAAALCSVAILCTNLRAERDVACTYKRRVALGKWCWRAYHARLRQMNAFCSQCHVQLTRSYAREHCHNIKAMPPHRDATLKAMQERTEAQMRKEMGRSKRGHEPATSGVSFQALQTLVRRLVQATSVHALCVNVASTFAQILRGTSAILFLFDPSSNELWTQREETHCVQVPAALGIAGNTVLCGSSEIILDVLADPRFHPMVDQLVLSGVQCDKTWNTTASQPLGQSPIPTYGMVSSALVSNDGAIYGVLQVAFSLSSLSILDQQLVVTQTQLYSKMCGFHVEQIVWDMLSNCRDRVRARVPDKFIRLFKQTKNWRKYYVALERKALAMEGKLGTIRKDHEQLLLSNGELQQRHARVQKHLEEKQQATKDVSTLVSEWKRKVATWQHVSNEKDQAILDKTCELIKTEKAFKAYRRERRSQDIQKVLPAECTDGNVADKCQEMSDCGELSTLKADKSRLQSQLVRAEADNLVLVKAVSMAQRHHGEHSRTIQSEVTRVATRVDRREPKADTGESSYVVAANV